MTAPNRYVQRRLGQRNQAGLTLMEVLLAIGIAAVLMAPLGAWAYGTVKAGFVSRDELGRASATGLLNSYFLRDVASARLVDSVSPADCTGSTLPHTPRLRLSGSGSNATSVVYAVSTGPAPVSLYRHVCNDDGTLRSSNRVVARMETPPLDAAVPASQRFARCFDPSRTEVDCADPTANRIQIRVVQWSKDGPTKPLEISATKRTTGTAVGFAVSSPPDPRISVVPASAEGYNDDVFVLTSNSTDPDGDPVFVDWTLPAGATALGPTVGVNQVRFRLQHSGWVQMSVRDSPDPANGNSSGGSVYITVKNRQPDVVVTQECTGAGNRTFTFSAAATDPDGDPLTYRWTDANGAVIANGGAATWAAPVGLNGSQVFTVTVSDDHGAAALGSTTCQLGGPAAAVTITPTPVNGVINAILPNGSQAVTFTVAQAGGSSVAWQLFRAGSPTPVNSSSGSATWTLTFVDGEQGDYEVQPVLDGVAGARVPFSVNRAPTVTLRVDAQAGSVPKLVSFTATATDPDGTIATTAWDFGDGTPVLHDAAGSLDHNYTAAGTYSARFTVTDNRGATGTVAVPIVVGP